MYCDTYEECITAIKNGGYATDTDYVSSICSIIKSNSLTDYDKKSSSSVTFKKGKTYTLLVDLKVRKGAGTSYAQKKYKDLTTDAKKHAYNQTYAVLKANTKVTCKKVVYNGNDVWLKIPSGYIAGYYNKTYYVK